MFSRIERIPGCDRRTDRQTSSDGIVRGKKLWSYISIIGSWAVAERPRDASCYWIFRQVSQGHSRSLGRFCRSHTSYYWRSIVTMALYWNVICFRDKARFGRKLRFLPHDAMHSADYAIVRSPSVCPSVCLFIRLSLCPSSHAGILSKRLNVSSNFIRIE